MLTLFLQSLVPGEVAKVRGIHPGMKLLHQAQFTLLSNHMARQDPAGFLLY